MRSSIDRVRYSPLLILLILLILLAGCWSWEWTSEDYVPPEEEGCTRQEFVSSTDGWAAYSAGGCGLREDGTFMCRQRWTNAELGVGPASDLMSETGLGADGLWCAVDEQSVARCWFWDVYTSGSDGRERERLLEYLETAPGYRQANNARGPAFCALTIEGALDCWIYDALSLSYVYGTEDFPEPIRI